MNLKKEIKLPKLHNFFIVKVKDAKTGELIKEARGENVVLDHWYGKIMSNSIHSDCLIALALGDGSGIPAASDTALFNYTSRFNFTTRSGKTISQDLYQFDVKCVLSESMYIGGSISEIGFWNAAADYETISHAMLQDSEGTPITLGPKLATQIWELYGTLFIERGIGMTPFPNAYTTFCTRESAYLSGWSEAYIYPQNLNIGKFSGNESPLVKTRSMPTTRLAAASGNADLKALYATTDILGFVFTCFSDAIWFPDTTVFPTFSFSERVVGNGNGIEKFFNLDSGFFVDDSEVIKVDDVIQTKGVDYKLNQGARQILNHLGYQYPYDSKVEALIYSTDSSKENEVLLGTANASSGVASDVSPYRLVDFQSVITVPNLHIRATGACTVSIYYSDDKVTWSGPISVTMVSTDYKLLTGLNGISARYLWMSCSGGRYINTYWTLYGQPSIEFVTPPGLVTAEAVGTGDGNKVEFNLDHAEIEGSETIYIDGIETTAYTIADGVITFTSAPAIDEVITADYKYSANVTASWDTEVPPKNANFFYDIGATVSFDW